MQASRSVTLLLAADYLVEAGRSASGANAKTSCSQHSSIGQPLGSPGAVAVMRRVRPHVSRRRRPMLHRRFPVRVPCRRRAAAR